MRRFLATFGIASILLLASLFAYTQTSTSSTNLGSKQPDKVLFDSAMKAITNSRYAEARTKLETLMSNYQDSSLVPQAKLSIGDAWYAEGNLKQAEMEYNDFVTFFPNRPEIAQAQSRINAIREALEIRK